MTGHLKPVLRWRYGSLASDEQVRGTMLDTKNHEALVGDQFGARANAYLTSAVHAQGRDLDALVALASSHRDARVLDLGCGGGHVAFNVAPHVREVVAYDLST